MIIRRFINPYYDGFNNRLRIVYEPEKPRYRYVRGRFYPLNHEAFENLYKFCGTDNFL